MRTATSKGTTTAVSINEARDLVPYSSSPTVECDTWGSVIFVAVRES